MEKLSARQLPNKRIKIKREFQTAYKPDMNYDNDNIFAKILRGDLPCCKVYEDDTTLAFMDIMPQAEGHTLVIPKEPATTLLELSDEGASDLIIKVKMIAKAVKDSLSASGITIFQLNGESAGQTVPHIHFHILPGSILAARSHATTASDPERLEQIAATIKAAIETT